MQFERRAQLAPTVGIVENCLTEVDNMTALTSGCKKGEIDKIQTLNTKMIIDPILEDLEWILSFYYFVWISKMLLKYFVYFIYDFN